MNKKTNQKSASQIIGNVKVEVAKGRIAILDKRLGAGVGAVRERTRLNKIINGK